ncbi:MAG: MOSC domain-containing protein [Pseudomonadota bacterium]
MPRLSAIRRHPVKALGGESLDRVRLAPAQTLPGDRAWALAHERSDFDFDAPAWTRCTAFLRGARIPALMAVESEAAPGGSIRFTHPERPELLADPATPEGEAALIAWVEALVPAGLPRPVRLASAPGRGMTDQRALWLSVLSDASLKALSDRLGIAPDRRRFRGNLWVEGLEPWAEFDWPGREIRIGAARLRLTERIGRCSATLADPETGRRDADVLGVLERELGHADFGVFAEVVEGGEIAPGDPVELAEAAA